MQTDRLFKGQRQGCTCHIDGPWFTHARTCPLRWPASKGAPAIHAGMLTQQAPGSKPQRQLMNVQHLACPSCGQVGTIQYLGGGLSECGSCQAELVVTGSMTGLRVELA